MWAIFARTARASLWTRGTQTPVVSRGWSADVSQATDEALAGKDKDRSRVIPAEVSLR